MIFSGVFLSFPGESLTAMDIFDPIPYDGAVDWKTQGNLYWHFAPPLSVTNYVFHVYLGTDPDSLNLLEGNISYVGNENFPPRYSRSYSIFQPSTQYFWQVVLEDTDTGIQYPGQIWSFTTHPEPVPRNININPLRLGNMTFGTGIEWNGTGLWTVQESNILSYYSYSTSQPTDMSLLYSTNLSTFTLFDGGNENTFHKGDIFSDLAWDGSNLYGLYLSFTGSNSINIILTENQTLQGLFFLYRGEAISYHKEFGILGGSSWEGRIYQNDGLEPTEIYDFGWSQNVISMSTLDNGNVLVGVQDELYLCEVISPRYMETFFLKPVAVYSLVGSQGALSLKIDGIANNGTYLWLLLNKNVQTVAGIIEETYISALPLSALGTDIVTTTDTSTIWENITETTTDTSTIWENITETKTNTATVWDNITEKTLVSTTVEYTTITDKPTGDSTSLQSQSIPPELPVGVTLPEYLLSSMIVFTVLYSARKSKQRQSRV